MNKYLTRAIVLLSLTAAPLSAQVPNLLNYQGRVAVGSVNFDGSGRFKFALVDAAGTTTWWSNDGTSAAGSEPVNAVTLTVTKGLYSVLMGDTALANMAVIPASVFANPDVHLRVWFDDGTNGSQRMTPDQRIAAVGYAIMADSARTVTDGAITGAKIAAGAVGSTQLGTHLTLSGVTSGSFAGSLNGNVTGSADSFSGLLAGDVLGTQGATVVSTVGTSTAASIHTAEVLANAATSNNTPGALVKRDGDGGFYAATLNLPATTSPIAGVVIQNGSPLLHTY